MWHIIVLILKIIGIGLLAILCLLLLLLLLALFVPVRYRAEGKKQEELAFRMRVTWLLHMVSVPLVYEKGKLSLRLKLFGFPIKDFLAEGKEEKEKEKEEEARSEEGAGRERDSEEGDDTAGVDSKPEDRTVEFQKDTEKGSWDKQEIDRAEDKNVCLKNKTPEDETEEWNDSLKEHGEAAVSKKKKFSLPRIFRGIWEKLKKLKYTIRSFCDKIRAVMKKAGSIRRFLTEETTKAALSLGMGQLLYLLKKLGPRKVQGWIHFGTGDPALTGEILGGISVLYAVSPLKLEFQPDFQDRVLEGEIRVKGHLHMVTLVGIAWRLWRDKNIKAVYKKIKKGF